MFFSRSSRKNSEDVREALEFREVDDGAAVVGYRNRPKKLAIPETLEGRPVVAIAAEAFRGCKTLRSLTLPSTTRRIGARAFAGCEKLVELTLPSGLSRLEAGVFCGCRRLASLTLPPTLETIGPEAFDSCDRLREIKGTCRLLTIGDRAFRYCGSLRNFEVVPGSVVQVGVHAFLGCWNLGNVYPGEFSCLAHDATVGAGAFNDCNFLDADTFFPNLKRYGAVRLEDPGNDGEFWLCYERCGEERVVTGLVGAASEATIPSELEGRPVVGIADRALSGYLDLRNCRVTLPDGLRWLGADAFDPETTLYATPGSSAEAAAWNVGLKTQKPAR